MSSFLVEIHQEQSLLICHAGATVFPQQSCDGPARMPELRSSTDLRSSDSQKQRSGALTCTETLRRRAARSALSVAFTQG